MKLIRKRDGTLVGFDSNKITDAISKAIRAVGDKDKKIADELSTAVVKELEERFGSEGIPTVEEIQDAVEKKLIEKGHVRTAKAYILYRKQHQDLREVASLLSNGDLIERYLKVEDWRIRENSNMSYSLQGLNNYISSTLIAKYWISRIYPPFIGNVHLNGDIHIHNLGVLGAYCVGWDLSDLLLNGFGGVSGKIESKPAKHFRTALGQIVNFFYTLQGESAGAQAFSNLDTYVAPFIKMDGLNYHKVKQALQEFFFNINIPTRVGFQTPFTNISFDLIVPQFMKFEPVIIKGKTSNHTYSEFQDEVDIFNAAFSEVMSNGDAKGRVFTFPIPTYSITGKFNWNSDVAEKIFEVTSKYGTPYFSNFINSDMKPEDVRSMCCHLRIDNRELRKRGGGLFGANPLTGSIGVVTINLPRIGYLQKTEDLFFERLAELMDLARDTLEIKRKLLEKFTERGLYPYSKHYLRKIKESYGKYWQNHFSTIGLLGMNEAILNLLGYHISHPDGLVFAIKVLKFMKNQLSDYQEETGNIYNLEATPAEGASYRLARIDKMKHPKIIVANEKHLQDGAEPFYTNSSQLPVDFQGDLFEAIEHQNNLQPLYTGGTVFHVYQGERINSWKATAELIRTIAENSRLPYFTLTPTFSICPSHGYLSGTHAKCPRCEAKCEVYSRVVGYLRPVDQWNDGKQSEFQIRKTFDKLAKYPVQSVK
jgi:anaerobic ribonucleoside-triphosphate reductase